jgi:hypothetical protein
MNQFVQTKPKNEFQRFIELSNEKGVIADGPLSKMYTDALNELYAKEVDEATGIAVETQALDAAIDKNWWLATQSKTNNFANQGEDVGMLYGVAKQEVEIKDVINVSDTLSAMTDEQKRNTAVVVDVKVKTNNTGDSYEIGASTFNPYEAALEAMCIAHRVPVFHSLEDFVESNKKDTA